MASLSIQSTAPVQTLQTQTQVQKPAVQTNPKQKSQKTEMASDSLSLGSTPSLGTSLKEGVKLQAGVGAKVGAGIGAVTGGLTIPILAVALTGGAAIGNSKMLLGSFVGGAVGGAVLGAGIGAVSGSVSGAVNGAIVSIADSKGEAQLYTGLVATGASVINSISGGESLTKGAVRAVISGGVAAYIGGRIYDNATQK